jgi:GH25 family lysozyme M1 (1,4-beta-N-acetylmuramidase)
LTGNPPVTFRAGRGPSEHTEALTLASAAGVMAAHTAGSQVLLADVSEFQANINDAKYLAWSKAIVIRAAYGAQHTDHAWFGGQRRDLLHAGGARFVGIYQYLAAGQDPARQAAALVSLIGQLRPGEKIIADIEEGSGNLRDTWRVWSAEIAGATGDDPWLYSGLNFASVHGLAPVTWVAAYQRSEPSAGHQLWQFTDAFAVPGVGSADCSVYHGTIDQLAALAHGGTRPPPPISWTETMIANLPVLTLNDSGEDVKTAQGLLKARGYNVTIDGAYGPATRAAVTAFQHAAALAADGICGPATWTRLLGR